MLKKRGQANKQTVNKQFEDKQKMEINHRRQ